MKRLLVASAFCCLPLAAFAQQAQPGSATNQPVTDTNIVTAAGPVTPGTAGTKSLLTGGVYNSSPVAPANGQQVAAQVDQNGALYVSLNRAAFPGSMLIGYESNTLPSIGTGTNFFAIDRRQNIKASEAGSDDPLVGITPAVAQSATSLVGKAAQGNLYGAYAILTASASAQTYLACINATAAPASGASITPADVAVFPSNAVGAQATLDYKAGPPNGYSTGITCLVTTSLTTYTPGSVSFMLVRWR